jgi:[methyl-Co(III) methanol-specific corrinoid protein]:coenzyme M methyltransferase
MMSAVEGIAPAERLRRAFRKEAVDRKPVICPGGMMNAAIVDVMRGTGHELPAAHFSDELMADLAEAVHDGTGFENFGIPFCMTVEAEALGSEIDIGGLACEPKIKKEAFASAAEVKYPEIKVALRSARISTTAQAAYRLSKRRPEVPVIGNLTGPISSVASTIEPMAFLKGLRRDRENSHRVLATVTEFLEGYAAILVEGGAKAISIADPTATGEILGPKMFEEYALPYINALVAGIHKLGVPVIVHICGDMGAVRPLIQRIGSDAISTDAMVDLRSLKRDYPSLTTMGNLSTYLLQFGTPEAISERAAGLLRDGIDIISPACGLSTSSSLDNIRAFTDTVKNGG